MKPTAITLAAVLTAAAAPQAPAQTDAAPLTDAQRAALLALEIEVGAEDAIPALRRAVEALSPFPEIAPDGPLLDAAPQHFAYAPTDDPDQPAAIVEVARLDRPNALGGAIEVSPDGAWLAAAFYRDLRVWPIAAFDEASPPDGTAIGEGVSRRSGFLFGPDRSSIVALSPEAGLIVFDVAAGLETARLGDRAYSTAAFSADGARLATVEDADGAFRGQLWARDGAGGYSVVADLGSSIERIRLSPDGAVAAVVRRGEIAFWSGDHDEPVAVRTFPNLVVGEILFSRDGARFFAALSDRSIRMFDAATGIETMRLEGHAGTIVALAASPDGRYLASGAWDHTARIWDLETGAERLRLNRVTDRRDFSTFAFVPPTPWLFSAEESGGTQLWSVETGALLASIPFSPVMRLLPPDAAGRWRVLTSSLGQPLRIWVVLPDEAALRRHLQRAAPRCLTLDERREAGLHPIPPVWCVTGPDGVHQAEPSDWSPVWPYRGRAWRDWVFLSQRGAEEIPAPTEDETTGP